MNRTEVIMTIKKAGAEFSHVMSALNGEEFAAGYRQAISDMIKLFGKASIAPDFEAERKSMLVQIERLKARNAELEQEVCEKHATIQKLLTHVNIAEVLGVNTKKD